MSAVATDTTAHLLARFGAGATGTHPTVLPAMSRNHLPLLCKDLGFTRGAEIGVWKGAYSAQFCAADTRMHMLCVDPWLSYPAWQDTKNSLPPGEQERFMADAYSQARKTLKPYSCTILRMFSAEASETVADRSLDLVYIDGNHVLEAVLEDLTLWAPKVRSGGIVAGHDYRAFANKPMIHVIEAVNAYTQAHGIDPWFITAADKTPSFFWVVA